MFDEHLDGQHRLSYLVRGPEWAFVLPQGDLEALDDVLCRCSELWNGAGSLLLGADRQGRLTPSGHLLSVRPVDRVWLHPALGDRARAGALACFPTATQMYEGFDEDEVHALLLAPEPAPNESKLSLLIPSAPTAARRRVVRALWGHVAEKDLSHWRARFEIGEVGGEAFLPALLAGQTSTPPACPLVLGRSHMNVVNQAAPLDWPYLYVLPARPGFEALVRFWNFRSRAAVDVPGMPVVGIPREALRQPDHLDALRRWCAPVPGNQRTPDLLVASDADIADCVDTALGVAGFQRDREHQLRHSFGDRVQPRERPLYRYFAPQLGGRLLRGAHAWSLVAFARGRGSMALPPPPGFSLRTGHAVRMVLRELPLPLPLTEPMATVLHRDGAARDGLLLRLAATGGDWHVDLRLPDRTEALTSWAAGYGWAVRPTQDGRYADALLERLGSLDRLDALAADLPVRVLEQLTPVSRPKLAQRLAAELREHEIDEERLTERLRGAELHLELPSRPPADLTGPGIKVPDVLKALEPLVDAGYVVRGRSLRCPRCNFHLWFGLDELAERVTCNACRLRFTLPLATGGGRRESPIEVRLDGLMARAMDQDLLPVLLALRAVRRRFAGYLFSAWPGVELTRNGRAVDVDLLAHGPYLLCCEVKANAASLERDQLDNLLALCDAVGARPGLAALAGTFEASLANEVRDRDGPVLHRSGLLA